jgi:N utilization substance protein B
MVRQPKQATRRDARELAIKALFASEIEKGDPLRQLEYIAGDWEMAGFEDVGAYSGAFPADGAYIRRLTAGVLSHMDELDEIITLFAVDWELHRLGGIERNILRIGLYEMLFDEKLHPAVAINEAVELTKKYGNPESSGFINSILDKKAKTIMESI